ncbi:hypothetical protein NLX86_07355 [Streptomyces sp. A3M-1-3]|uniref:hypothetical protein n=1 Tax=Streptomyces sp. A3M-1-3 TaxID=2962044 RepID=UPI0020B8563D|nr:hypothetical protein [Streptomyces sp. A3M-1-3]MCP3817955.1 hypothetical protein [Streptomyces sp. A3M-1-3]
MRVMLRAHLDIQASNDAIKSGKLPQILETLTERVKPEAAYFNLNEGVRSFIMVFDLQDSADLVAINEPLFAELGAMVEVQPVMNREDLQKGLAALQR